MSVLGNLEKQLGIKPIDFSDIKGVDLSTPTQFMEQPKVDTTEPRHVVPNIPLSTFGKLDMLWGCSHGTAQELYEKLCADLPYAEPYKVQIIQKILSGMQCGNIPKNKLNEYIRQLCGG